jgi:ADP-ribose pyrophosphatase
MPAHYERLHRFWFHQDGVARVVGLQSAQFIRATGESVLKNETIHYKGRYLGMKEHDRWEYAFRTNASGVIVLVPVTDAGELVLVEQYRVPVQSRVLELPAGLVGDSGNLDEDFKIAAHRELLEETGYRADSLEQLMTSPSSPGMANEMITIYFASGLERVGPGGGDGSEDITVHHLPLGNAVEWLKAREAEGLMIDHKIFAGLFWAGSRS